jgi:hypothetical protein
MFHPRRHTQPTQLHGSLAAERYPSADWAGGGSSNLPGGRNRAMSADAAATASADVMAWLAGWARLAEQQGCAVQPRPLPGQQRIPALSCTASLDSLYGSSPPSQSSGMSEQSMPSVSPKRAASRGWASVAPYIEHAGQAVGTGAAQFQEAPNQARIAEHRCVGSCWARQGSAGWAPGRQQGGAAQALCQSAFACMMLLRLRMHICPFPLTQPVWVPGGRAQGAGGPAARLAAAAAPADADGAWPAGAHPAAHGHCRRWFVRRGPTAVAALLACVSTRGGSRGGWARKRRLVGTRGEFCFFCILRGSVSQVPLRLDRHNKKAVCLVGVSTQLALSGVSRVAELTPVMCGGSWLRSMPVERAPTAAVAAGLAAGMGGHPT